MSIMEQGYPGAFLANMSIIPPLCPLPYQAIQDKALLFFAPGHFQTE